MARTPGLMMIGRTAEFLGISRKRLREWHRDGVAPPRTLKSKRWWYSREALKEWLKAWGTSASSPPAPRLQTRLQPSPAPTAL